MNVIYVLTPELEMAGVIEEYVSAIWRPSYYEIGDFELYLSASAQAFDLLRKNRYVVRSQDVSEVDGVKTFKKVMIIKNIALSTDVEEGDYLTVTGKELKYLFNQRIVWSHTVYRDTAEYAIRRLAGYNAIDPVDPARTIPNMVFGEAKGFTETAELSMTHKQLDAAITEACKLYNYGWDIYISDGKLVFDIYTGTDRSYEQSERPYVVFSDDFNNLYNSSYELKSEEYANMALVAGEGEGVERVRVAVNGELEGLERYEIFVDARDISQNADSEDEALTDDEYSALLQERGMEKLADKTMTEGFSGEIISDMTYVYGVDFFLGDIITVSNKYGITRNARVISAIESEDEEGAKLVPQLNL